MEHRNDRSDRSNRSNRSDRTRLLYIVYWGLLEPLGQALVVPPLLRFAKEGLGVTAVSFEKLRHPADVAFRRRLAEDLAAAGIHWIPLRYHQRPAAPATVWDIACGASTAVLSALRTKPDIVQGRTWVGGVIGRWVASALRRPFVYHPEGFWPDEQVAGGWWRPDGLEYRVTKRIENRMHASADGVVTLSAVARDEVVGLRAGRVPESTVVVPSCVDLDRFRPAETRSRAGCRLVYVGSLGGRYPVSMIGRFTHAVRREMPEGTLQVWSHSDQDMIRDELRKEGLAEECCSIGYLQHEEIPAALAGQQVGLHLLAPGGRYVGSPAKVGEYWACGLPVVTTAGVGDLDAIVRQERVGIMVDGDTTAAYAEAAAALRSLLEDPGLSQRCREAAIRHYSLEAGVRTQLDLYDLLLSRSGSNHRACGPGREQGDHRDSSPRLG